MIGVRTVTEVQFAGVPTDFVNEGKSKIVNKLCQELTPLLAESLIGGSEISNAVQLVAATIQSNVVTAATEKFASNATLKWDRLLACHCAQTNPTRKRGGRATTSLGED